MSPSSPTRRRLMRRPERRRSILEAGARAFARNGYAATSLEEVAAEAGVTKMLIYQHFESKEELYLAILEETRQRIRAATAGHQDSLEALARLLEAAREDPHGYALLFRHAAREPEFADYAEEFTVRRRKRADQLLEPHIADPVVRRWVASTLSRLTIDGIADWVASTGPERDAEFLAVLGETVEAVTRAAARAESRLPRARGQRKRRPPA